MAREKTREGIPAELNEVDPNPENAFEEKKLRRSA